jgi:hypothetical protein
MIIFSKFRAIKALFTFIGPINLGTENAFLLNQSLRKSGFSKESIIRSIYEL